MLARVKIFHKIYVLYVRRRALGVVGIYNNLWKLVLTDYKVSRSSSFSIYIILNKKLRIHASRLFHPHGTLAPHIPSSKHPTKSLSDLAQAMINRRTQTATHITHKAQKDAPRVIQQLLYVLVGSSHDARVVLFSCVAECTMCVCASACVCAHFARYFMLGRSIL